MSAALLGAQAKSADNSGKASDPGKSGAANAATVTFIGCVTPGTTSDSFFLINSKQKGVKAPAAATMKLVPATKKVGIGSFVTQGVEVTGTLEQAANGGPATFTVTKIKSNEGGC